MAERGVAFSARLRRMRMARDLQQKEAARALGISPQYFCDLEAGRRMPSVAVVERICDLLDCSDYERRSWRRAGARAHGWDI